MSEPAAAMDQAEQARLTRAIGRALLTVAPADWTSIRADYRAAGRHIEVDVFVAGPDNVPRPVQPPAEVVEGLGQLRAGMYQPGRGTWISASYTLEPPSSYSVDFDLDNEPRWRRLPPPIGFQDELRFFPRTPDFIPDWFRHRAGLPPITPPPGQPTPPAGQPLPPHQPPPGQPMPPPGQPRPPDPGAPQPPPGPRQPPHHPPAQPAPPTGHPLPVPGRPMPPPPYQPPPGHANPARQPTPPAPPPPAPGPTWNPPPQRPN